MTIPQIIEQHAAEASFHWLLRDDAVMAPHYSLKDLADQDNRVEAHLDGLRIAGEGGWTACRAALAIKEPGEVFAAGVLALEGQARPRIEAVLTTAAEARETVSGFVGACAWVSPELLTDTVFPLIEAEEPALREAAVAAHAVHRRYPGPALVPRFNDPDPAIRARALRLAGQLGRSDLWGHVDAHGRADDDPTCRLWGNWSAVRLGDRDAAFTRLFETSLEPKPTSLQMHAVKILARTLPSAQHQAWFSALAQNPDNARALVAAVGAVGLPFHIPWLIEHMAEPSLARLAGEGVSMITGLDLAYEDLDGDEPDGFEASPSEDPDDEDVDLDPDEDLPWPSPKLIDAWWRDNRSHFGERDRHLCGAPITAEQCRHVLIHGFQRQRIAAALELAVQAPEHPLFETAAPGPRQQAWLGVTGQSFD